MKKKKNAARRKTMLQLLSMARVIGPPRAYEVSVPQLMSVVPDRVSSSIKVLSLATSLIKSSRNGERRGSGFSRYFFTRRYCNESNRDPILIGGSLPSDTRRENKKPKDGIVKIKRRSVARTNGRERKKRKGETEETRSFYARRSCAFNPT